MFSEKQGNVLHGILLIVLFSFSAFYIAEFQFIKNLSLSPLIVGIILGMLYANSLRNRLPETWVPGIKFCSKQVLRAGIYNPQIQISEKSQTKRLEIADSRKTKRPITDKRTTPNKRHSNAIITL